MMSKWQSYREKSRYLWFSSAGSVSLNNSLFICISVRIGAVQGKSWMGKNLLFQDAI